MKETTTDAEQMLCSSSQDSLFCAKCYFTEQQLQFTLTELKSAQAIIALLREDIRHANLSSNTEMSSSPQPTESTSVNHDNQKWITVSNINSYNINKRDSKLVNVKNPLLTSNRFAPLINLKEDQQAVPSTKCNTNLLSVTHTSMKPTIQRGPGSKIPTIVNGRISHNFYVKKSTKLSTKVKPSSTVKIIGDSFLKGSSTRISQYLSSKFEVSSFIKPGACINNIVQSQEKELNCLGPNDVIIINGGTNDLNKLNFRATGILTKMINFILKYNNTNILIVNIPHRYDQANSSQTNQLIHAYNSKLKNLVKPLKHVSIIETSLDRRHFTKHGLHMNNLGKEKLAKQIALQLLKLIKSSPYATKSVIPLKWKDETVTPKLTITINHGDSKSESENPNMEPLTLENFPQNNARDSSNVTLLRTSTRNKKPPSTMTKDFLW